VVNSLLSIIGIMMSKKYYQKIFFVLFIILSTFSETNGQFEYFSLEEGLSQANVRCILQDKDGFLWFGTQDGLNRFDGYQFTQFRNEPGNPNSIPGNYISCLNLDQAGNILIGTINGATVYNPRSNTFNKIMVNDSLKNLTSISSMISTMDGSLWIGDYYSGILRINKSKQERFIKNENEVNSLNENYVTALCEDQNGDIWIGTFNSGISKYCKKNRRFEHIKNEPGSKWRISSNSITALCTDNNGNVFIGTTNGLNVINYLTKKITVYKNVISDRNSISGNSILSIFRDTAGNIWVAIEGKGVNVFDLSKKTFSKISVESKNNPVSEEINIGTIYEDKNGNYWLGTSISGAIKWNKNTPPFKSISKKLSNNFLSDYSVRSVLRDKENNLWIGTDNGLNKISAKSGFVTKYFNRAGDLSSINDNKIWAIHEDKKSNLWIGTQRGLALYRRESNNFKRIILNRESVLTPPIFGIRSIHVDNDNILWFGTYGAGLYSYDIQNKIFKNHTAIINHPDAKKDLVIFQIDEDPYGKLWLVSASGLAVYNKKNGEYKRYFSDSNDHLTGLRVLYSLNRQNDSTYWLGTLGQGLIKFNPIRKTIINYTEKNGLSNNVVYGILRDKKNNLWLSTNHGISKFNPATKQFINYDKKESIPSDEFNTGAFTSDRNGYLYFGGIEGLLFFNPDSIKNRLIIPMLAVTNFKVNDKLKIPNKVYFDGELVSLDYTGNYFSFEYAAINPSMKNTEYAYMLEEYDEEWIYSGKRRYAAYTKVDPGKYILKIKVVNGEGSLTKEMNLAVIISPPYWATIWFRSFVITFLLAMLILVYKKRIKRLKHETEKQIEFSRKLITAQEGERKRLASEFHDGIVQNLLIVSNLSHIGIKNPEKAGKNLISISETIKETIKDIRQLATDLHPYQIEELGVTIAIQSMVNRIKQSSDIIINDFIENVDQFLKIEDAINLFRIVQEAVTNCIKHSGAKNLVISISVISDGIQLVIKDDGIGISQTELSKSQLGLGLHTMRERAVALNGKFSIDSSEENGTIIKVMIPT